MTRLTMERVVTDLTGIWTHVRQRVRRHILNGLSGLINALEALYGRIEGDLGEYSRYARIDYDRDAHLER